jgi:hypothetical protein
LQKPFWLHMPVLGQAGSFMPFMVHGTVQMSAIITFSQ